MIELTYDKLKELREKMSVAEIAKFLKVSPSTISRYIKIAKFPPKKSGKNKIKFVGRE